MGLPPSTVSAIVPFGLPRLKWLNASKKSPRRLHAEPLRYLECLAGTQVVIPHSWTPYIITCCVTPLPRFGGPKGFGIKPGHATHNIMRTAFLSRVE